MRILQAVGASPTRESYSWHPGEFLEQPWWARSPFEHRATTAEPRLQPWQPSRGRCPSNVSLDRLGVTRHNPLRLEVPQKHQKRTESRVRSGKTRGTDYCTKNVERSKDKSSETWCNSSLLLNDSTNESHL